MLHAYREDTTIHTLVLLVHVAQPLLLLLVRSLPDKVHSPDLREALTRLRFLVGLDEAVNRQSGEDITLRLVLRSVEGAVRVIVVRELGANGKVEQPGGQLSSGCRQLTLWGRQILSRDQPRPYASSRRGSCCL